MTEEQIADLIHRMKIAMADMYEPFSQQMKESIKKAKQESLSSKYGRFYTIKKSS